MANDIAELEQGISRLVQKSMSPATDFVMAFVGAIDFVGLDSIVGHFL